MGQKPSRSGIGVSDDGPGRALLRAIRRQANRRPGLAVGFFSVMIGFGPSPDPGGRAWAEDTPPRAEASDQSTPAAPADPQQQPAPVPAPADPQQDPAPAPR